jgi:cellulose synthase/poly-beta-1,6-N-acetylglucosamine synthase-like glycosyltransferase
MRKVFETLYIIFVQIGLLILYYFSNHDLYYAYITVGVIFSLVSLYFLIESITAFLRLKSARNKYDDVTLTLISSKDSENQGKNITDGLNTQLEIYPVVSAIIVAYLPNEVEIITQTLEEFRKLRYPNKIQVILSYNLKHDDNSDYDEARLLQTSILEETLSEYELLNDESFEFEILKVWDSRSKAENINYAISAAKGDVIGIFDADHHPRHDVFVRAVNRIQSGVDIIQGHCMIRNADTNALTKLIAIEFEMNYSLGNYGRDFFQGFGIFGGSNGYWRKSTLSSIRMDKSMMTEDIDSSIRAIMSNYKIKYDNNIVSTELAPTKLSILISQRLRWAQGWAQVALRHFISFIKSERTIREKISMFFLFIFREFYHYIPLQLLPLSVSYFMLNKSDVFDPKFIYAALFNFSVFLAQTIIGYSISNTEVKKVTWFMAFFLISPIYGLMLNIVGTVSHFRLFTRHNKWIVTRR